MKGARESRKAWRSAAGPAGRAAAPAAVAGDRKATLFNVQGLRGIAALVVVVAHVSGPGGFEERLFGHSWISWANLPANVGVDLFFVISGLIMVVTTWRTFDEPGASRRFLLRRVARIYPLYWVVNTAVVVILLVRPASVSFGEGHHPNILESYLLLPQDGRLPVLVAWSLVYEMYFYLVFALALVLGRSRFLWVIGAWVTTTLTLSVVASDATNPYVAHLANPQSLEFVLGLLIGLAVVHGRYVQPRAVLAAGVLSCFACVAVLGLVGWSEFPSPGVRVALVAIPAGLVVYGAIGVEVVRGAVVSPFVQHLGDASYSLFLTHVPALTLVVDLLGGRLPATPWVHAVMLPAAFVLVVVGAFVCHAVVERPLQDAAKRLLRSAERRDRRVDVAQ